MSQQEAKASKQKSRIDLKVGFACNNHCLHCVQGNKRERYSPRQTGEIKAFLRQSQDEALDLVITGGEPTIRQDITELVHYARELGYAEIQVQSNGRLFSSLRFCQEMTAAGANVFVLALLSHKEAVHNYLTQSNSFKQTVKGILNLKSLGQKVKINCVVTKVNYRYLPQTAQFFVKLGVDQFQFAFVHIQGSAMENYLSIAPRKTLAMPYIRAGLRVGLDAGVPVFTEAIPFCLMRGYEFCVAERIIPETKIYDAEGIVESFSEVRRNEGKAKQGPCRSCMYDPVCEGPWKEYTDIFGWGEFVPVTAGRVPSYLESRGRHTGGR